MTLNLNEAEMKALETLAKTKDMSKTAVIRQALRLYQYVDENCRQGRRLFVEDSLQKSKTDIVIL